MGLGKSLQTLMLILSNPPPQDWPAAPVPLAAAAAAVRPTAAATSRSRFDAAAAAAPWAPATALMDPGDDEPVPIKATLLITPATLQVEQWVEEMERHLQPNALKGIYNGFAHSIAYASSTGGAAAAAAAGGGDDGEGTLGSRRTARAIRQLGSTSAAPAAHRGPKLLPPAVAHGPGDTL
ncbi:hypothetical protein TSOC_015245, partial [Tetrabaena socialis]